MHESQSSDRKMGKKLRKVGQQILQWINLNVRRIMEMNTKTNIIE